jgi:deoxyribodipyrimidine photolyase-related protein
MPDLRIILPDQLDRSYLESWLSKDDVLLMAETGYLFTPQTHKRKLALICSAGRHFAEELRGAGYPIEQRTVAKESHRRSLEEHIADVAAGEHINRIVVHLPGSFCELHEIQRAAQRLSTELVVDDDPSFFCSPGEFREYASGRKRLVMEYFYRWQREKHDILMDGDRPEGGDWNYDDENRDSFSKDGPPDIPPIFKPEPSRITQETIEEIDSVFSENPGSLEGFAIPVTPGAAAKALRAFVDHRLSAFGRWQDAMWSDESFLFHSVLSPSLNLRLLGPRQAVGAAVAAYDEGDAPLNSVEGFVRQILGWREFVRGVYYLHGQDYIDQNYFSASAPLPKAYWNGKSEMSCVSHVMESILEEGYAHHIERLMVMGLYGLLHGVDPREFHEWHLAMYLDAYDWVSAPNVIGMSQFADGGEVATKPYVASGKYIKRMSNYCGGCRYDPDEGVGEQACPFTTLYWDFLARHENKLSGNRRMNFQLANLRRKKEEDIEAMQEQAAWLRNEA